MKRDPGPDFLRALAIAWVVMIHCTMVSLGSPIGVAAAAWGWMGVDLFFALSGYLIGSQLFKVYAQGGHPSTLGFYRRRAFRILPAYLIVLTLYFTVPLWRENPTIAPLWRFLTFTLNLGVDFATSRSFDVAWSLCVEEHFYLFFPLLVWWLMRRPSGVKTIAVCSVIVAAGLLLRAHVWLHVLRPAVFSPHRTLDLFTLYLKIFYTPTYLRMDGLLAGVCVAALRWFRPALWAKAMAHGTLLFACGLALVAGSMRVFYHAFFDFWPAVFGYPLLDLGMAVLVMASVSPKSPIGRFPIPGIRALATLAFSIYLTHMTALHLVRLYPRGNAPSLSPDHAPALSRHHPPQTSQQKSFAPYLSAIHLRPPVFKSAVLEGSCTG